MSDSEQRMHVLRYQVNFLTPAFLGNAHQAGQWRTPPFKALLRQWWRVAVAREFDYDWERIRTAEGKLFGHAHGDKKSTEGARASRVRLRLDLEPGWNEGTRGQSWPETFKRVTTTKDGKGKVPSDLYLGYGPIQPKERKAAIDPTETAKFRLLCADGEAKPKVRDAMQLAQWFGAMGSRSRNGWGSLHCSVSNGELRSHHDLAGDDLLTTVTRPLAQCLSLDWPHAVGKDDKGPLIWISGPLNSWPKAVDEIARLLVEFRSAAKGFRSRGRELAAIHLLGYPAGGGWRISKWGKDDKSNEARFSSPLRFKVIPDDGQLRILVVHLPSNVPCNLRKRLHQRDQSWLEENGPGAWQAIHAHIDARMDRVGQPWPSQSPQRRSDSNLGPNPRRGRRR